MWRRGGVIVLVGDLALAGCGEGDGERTAEVRPTDEVGTGSSEPAPMDAEAADGP